jgi:hypothetical protein
LADPTASATLIVTACMVALLLVVFAAIQAGTVPRLTKAMVCTVELRPGCLNGDAGEPRLVLARLPDAHARAVRAASRAATVNAPVELNEAIPWIDTRRPGIRVVPRTISGVTPEGALYRVEAGATVRIELGPGAGDVSASFLDGSASICHGRECRRVLRISRLGGRFEFELDPDPILPPGAHMPRSQMERLLRRLADRFSYGWRRDVRRASGRLLTELLFSTSPEAGAARQRMVELSDAARDLVEFWSEHGMAPPERIAIARDRLTFSGRVSRTSRLPPEVAGLDDYLRSGEQRGLAMLGLAYAYADAALGPPGPTELFSRMWRSAGPRENSRYCYAGYWMAHMLARNRLTAGDIAHVRHHLAARLTDNRRWRDFLPDRRLASFNAGFDAWETGQPATDSCDF